MKNNDHISDFLKYYSTLISPGYAVMLRGGWGVGKTWYIKQFIRGSEENYLYISLYGITSLKEIDDSFFQLLHPFLGSKGMKIAGKIFTGLLKASLKIDLADKEELTISSNSLTDINLKDSLNKIDAKTIIFDDMERCQIPINDILGYLNQLVENNGSRIILISNEEKINKSQTYHSIKEKVIGRCFDVLSDFNLAIESFIEEIKSKYLKDILYSRKPVISGVFENAGYQNLRHLRHTLLDFERFYANLPQKTSEKEDLLNHILTIFFAVSFELKSGKITESDILEFLAPNFSVAKDSNLTEVEKIKNKYEILRYYSHPISENSLEYYFRYGTNDKESIGLEITNSNYFHNENTPAWQKIKELWSLSDDEFRNLFEEVWQNYKNKGIQDKYAFIETTKMLFDYADASIIPVRKEEISRHARENIQEMGRLGHLKSKDNEPSITSYIDIHPVVKVLPEYYEFLKLLTEAYNQSEQSEYSVKGLELVNTLIKSVSDFEEMVIITGNPGKNEYYDIPILSYIAPDSFARAITTLTNGQKNHLGRVLKKRYNFADSTSKLMPELNWLKELAFELKKMENEFNQKLSWCFLRMLIAEIENISAQLESVKYPALPD